LTLIHTHVAFFLKKKGRKNKKKEMADSKSRESERKKEEAMRLAEMMSGAVKQVKPKLGLFCFCFFPFCFLAVSA
jgi:hypothetical protein